MLCCELLSKFIIFAVGNNRSQRILCFCAVVNCFQNLLSLQSETTGSICIACNDLLWIAFKIYYLCSRKQPFLSGRWERCVVNCFQNLLSLQSETTIILSPIVWLMLWIAFKIYYLCSRKQQSIKSLWNTIRCELLSKFIIFAVGNNMEPTILHVLKVVNCFQNLLSLQSETTSWQFVPIVILLWIAFKIYYLCSRKQR